MGLMTVFYWFNFHFCKSFIRWSNSIVWILIWTQLASNYKTFAVQTQDKKSNFWIILKNHFFYINWEQRTEQIHSDYKMYFSDLKIYFSFSVAQTGNPGLVLFLTSANRLSCCLTKAAKSQVWQINMWRRKKQTNKQS